MMNVKRRMEMRQKGGGRSRVCQKHREFRDGKGLVWIYWLVGRSLVTSVGFSRIMGTTLKGDWGWGCGDSMGVKFF